MHNINRGSNILCCFHDLCYALGLLCSYRPFGLLCSPALSIHSLLADEVCKNVQQTRRVDHLVVIDVALRTRHPAL